MTATLDSAIAEMFGDFLNDPIPDQEPFTPSESDLAEAAAWATSRAEVDSSATRVPVRVAPLILSSNEGRTTVDEQPPSMFAMDLQLLVDYTRTTAQRAANAIRDDKVEFVDHPHEHSDEPGRPCVRCAVLGRATHRTLAQALLEILELTGSGEEWNSSERCNTENAVSRIRDLAKTISANTLEELYGEHWGEVMLAALRIENADFELLHYLARKHQPTRVLTAAHTRESLAAYHLAVIVTPRRKRDGTPAPSMVRGAVALRMAIAAARTSLGASPEWLDHLPEPGL
ncbi:Uncharacterised protein (plasmid) [Tsukamurella tyrosinosolvens]|uniref:Uncharacterized protein n=1 Tax=Tsukamurella tyrosinosolvens TaxID=57704 RepID=A0A1H4UDB8_TSUTY|nr:hypothetical protein [Tsukamurella tyrosinosolvens]KXO92966.1 hypothetical protein AXK58_13935 [Tsukamurella tyrosinosolvens]SEC66291.1 hypothetical protein SAMN04489793_2850 [Tsukamurella tyrosinosolvens]VEH94123.1 Uncharacterised protein [Tsukamurella tyrosinosolvens]